MTKPVYSGRGRPPIPEEDKAVRISITIPREMSEAISSIESNRSAFIVRSVERELKRLKRGDKS